MLMKSDAARTRCPVSIVSPAGRAAELFDDAMLPDAKARTAATTRATQDRGRITKLIRKMASSDSSVA
jgi:hypothetical protein